MEKDQKLDKRKRDLCPRCGMLMSYTGSGPICWECGFPIPVKESHEKDGGSKWKS